MRKQKTMAILLISVFILSFTGVFASVNASTTWDVVSGESIQTVIDGATTGDVIQVYAGTYVEDLVIDKTLELVAAEDGVTIKGVAYEASLNFPLAQANIEILADGVEIHGFTIQGPNVLFGHYASGMVIGASNVEIYNNAFEVYSFDDMGQGIQTYNKRAMLGVDISGLNIHDNTFTNYGDGVIGYEGIYINRDVGVGKVTVTNNEFTGAIIRGITTERSNTDIISNTLTVTEVSLAWTGVLVMDVGGFYDLGCELIDNVVVTDNTLKDFGNGVKLGHTTQALTGIEVAQNLIQSNDIGVWVRSDADDIVVNNNNLLDNAVGINSVGLVVLDATYNWWGDVDGPLPADVVGDIDYTPWLTALWEPPPPPAPKTKPKPRRTGVVLYEGFNMGTMWMVQNKLLAIFTDDVPYDTSYPLVITIGYGDTTTYERTLYMKPSYDYVAIYLPGGLFPEDYTVTVSTELALLPYVVASTQYGVERDFNP